MFKEKLLKKALKLYAGEYVLNNVLKYGESALKVKGEARHLTVYYQEVKSFIVKISTKEDSLHTVRKECIDLLDLSFTESDIQVIEADGVKSLERDYTEGVIECLTLFADLLGFKPPPKAFKMRHHEIIGGSEIRESGEVLYGPIVVYSLIENEIKLIDEQIASFDKGKIENFQSIFSGNQEASKQGAEVFAYLKEAVLKKK